MNGSIYYPNTDISLTQWLPSLTKPYIDLPTNAWFHSVRQNNPKPKSFDHYIIAAPVIPDESYKQQLAAIRNFKQDRVPEFITTSKIRIFPNFNQRIILDEWFRVHIQMYNKTVEYVNSQIFVNKKIDLALAKKIASFRKLRPLLKVFRSNIIQNMEDKIPVHILDEAIKLAVANFKSCITKMENFSIKKFRVRNISYNKKQKILIIESNLFNGTTFCSRTFKTMKSSKPLDDIDRTVTLQFDARTGKYILLVPITTPEKQSIAKKIDCGADPGGRTFMTLYSNNNTYSIGTGINECLKKYYKKITKIQDLLQNYVLTSKKRSRLKKGLNKYHLMITNMVKDLHYKTALLMVIKFDNIYIGKLSTSQVLSKRNRLPKKAKWNLQMLSHYLFRTRLIHMGHKYGAKVYEVNEYLTSKTCSNCGNIKNVQGEIYECDRCKIKTGRDENAAKNILKVGYVESERKS